jgi:hypothetical protein
MQSRSPSLVSLAGAAVLAVSTLVVACGGGGTGTGGSISISVNPTSATVQQGGSTQVTGTITRSGGFDGEVTFSVTGTIPPGLTGAVSNINTSGTTTTATITLSTTSATPAGTHTITVRASGSGVDPATASFQLTVTAAGSYTLSLNPASLSIAQGANGNTTVSINRTNFTGPVTLAVEGLPTGVTASFNPASPVSANSTVLTLTATASALVGPATVTIRGTTPGQSAELGANAIADQSVTLSLTITATSSGGFTLSATPPTVNVTAGAGGTSTININRTGGFAGSVTLAVSGQVTGLTASLSPTPTTGNTSTLTISTTTGVGAGPFTLTITGTATGQANQTTTVTVTITAAGSFTLSATPPTVNVTAGAGGTSTININRTGGFAGDVALTVSGQVTGLTATLSPTSTTGNTSTLTISTTTAVGAGPFTLTITGTATGQANQTTTVSVTITAAGSFTLSATPATLSFAQGAGGTSTININRTGGFAGNVALTVTGQIANLTATLSPTSTTGNTSTLTITTTAAVATGPVTLTITGISGSITQTTTVALTVTGTGGGGNVTLNFSACPATAKAIWLAGLNGTTWTAVTGALDVYTFNVSAAKGGYAYVTQNGATNSLTVFLGTQAEVTGTINFCTGTTPTGKTVTGTVSGFGSGTFPNVNVNLGGAFNTANSFTPAFTLNNVPDGPVDFIAWLSDVIDPPSASNNRGLAMRGINPANGSSLGTIDMSGGSSFAAASGVATVTGLVGGEALLGGVSYLTSTGGVCRSAQLYSILNGASGMTIFGFPAGQQQAGDYHQISLIATSGTVPNTTFRQHTEVFATMGNRTFAFAPAFTGTVTSLGGANKRLQVTGTIPALYNSAVSLVYNSTSPNRGVVVSATPGWIGGTSLTLGLDEFNGLTGWQTSFAPLAAATVNYSATVSGFSSLSSTTCVEGLTTRAAAFSGQM